MKTTRTTSTSILETDGAQTLEQQRTDRIGYGPTIQEVGLTTRTKSLTLTSMEPTTRRKKSRLRASHGELTIGIARILTIVRSTLRTLEGKVTLKTYLINLECRLNN